MLISQNSSKSTNLRLFKLQFLFLLADLLILGILILKNMDWKANMIYFEKSKLQKRFFKRLV